MTSIEQRYEEGMLNRKHADPAPPSPLPPVTPAHGRRIALLLRECMRISGATNRNSSDGNIVQSETLVTEFKAIKDELRALGISV